MDYSVLSYAYAALGRAQEVQTGLNGLLKSMYLYSTAAKTYKADYEALIPTGILAGILNEENWSTIVQSSTEIELTLSPNSVLKADYLKSLWDEGYTHLVFTVRLTGDDGAYVHDSDNIYRYWNTITAGVDTDVRIDLNEFHDGDTWYNLRFAEMLEGTMIVSNPRAYSSAETLQWTKNTTNIYFALEDGYYVFDARGGWQTVTSPASWKARYSTGSTWLVYTDFLVTGSNYRSVLWGFGSAVNQIKNGTDGGWVTLDNMSSGEVFSLTMENGGISRFKIADMVASKNTGSIGYVADNTFTISSTAAEHNFIYAATQELMAAGWTKLKVTLTGSLPDGTNLWYGDGNWGNGGSMAGIGAGNFTDGAYTFQVDLSIMGENEYFTLMTSGNSASNPIENIQVHIEPAEYVKPLATYQVTAPTGEGFAFNGAETVLEGESYIFTVTPDNALATVTVTVNGNAVTGVDGTYTVENVNADLTITVEVAEPNAVKRLLDSGNWNTIPQGSTATSVTLSQNSSLKAEALKALWDEGYTHLVFTANLTATGSYINGGPVWDRYWSNLDANVDTDVRIDLNEFHDGDTWYSLNFINMASGTITVSNPRAYSSAETLQWTKNTTNIYFALEDGYYVFDARGGGQTVTSPASWKARYSTGSTWLVYTDFLVTGSNYRSVLWGFGSAVNQIKDGTDGGWVTLDNMSSGEVFSLTMDNGGISRFKIADMVANKNAGSIGYVADNTFTISSTAAEHNFIYAATQELMAAGWTKLNVTLTGSLPDGTSLWYGDGNWGNGGSMAGIGAGNFTDGAYTFQVDLSIMGENEYFTLMTSGNSASNPIENIRVHIEPAEYVKPLATYQVTAPTGEGFAFDGAAVATEGQSYTFTVTPDSIFSAITVTVNGNAVTGVDGTYTVENVNSDLNIQVSVVFADTTTLLMSGDNWNGTVQEATPTGLTLSANPTLKADYLKSLWNEGYTHLVFTANAETDGAYINGSSVWDRFWGGVGANSQVRLDLNEFHDGDTWYNMPIINMTGGNITISNPKAYKSAETLEWTKSTTNIYMAIEDGYYIIEFHGGAQKLTAPAEWVSKYMLGNTAVAKCWLIYTDYINAGGNPRSILWGQGGNAVNNITGVDGGWTMMNDMSGSAFSLHSENAGCIARFKIADMVANKNTGSIGYVDDNTFVINSTVIEHNFIYAATQELMAAGATKLNVTLTGSLPDGTSLWYGDGNWGNGGSMAGIGAGNFTDGAYTFQVDLSIMGENEYFTLMTSGNSASNPIENIQVHIEPVMDGTPKLKKAIVLAADTPAAVGIILKGELNSVDSGYKVYTAEQAQGAELTDSIIVGSGYTGASFQAESEGEAYAIVGDGANIYIDGNCARAEVYGAYDLLRSLGYEFFSADVTTRPAALNLDYSVNIQDSAEFAIRAYLSGNTSYVTGSSQQFFTAASKNNNGQYMSLDSYGGMVEYGYYENPTHNFIHVFNDHTEGKYGMTVSTGVDTNTGFAPCLTNGITYNVGGADTTLTYGVARMKALILNNPDKYYFTFCQDDGSNWHCSCEYCTASNTQYNGSGTLVNFINAMISALKADPDLAGRDFEIITLAYDFTKEAPIGGVAPCEELVIWYAGYQDSRYSITAANQTASFKDNLNAWIALTTGEGNGSLALWLYDTSFNNYMTYYSTTTINNAVDETIAAAKAAGVDNILVLGAYSQQNNWQSDMKAYIWSAKLWGTDKTTAQLQEDFLNAYFGPAASYAKEFMSIYDTAQKNLSSDWMISSGWGFYYRNNMRMTVHGEAINQALAAVAATENGSAYWQRANGLLASAYATVIYDYDKHLDDCTGILSYNNGCREYADLLGGDKATFTQMLKDAFANAGVTRPCEPNLTVDEWLNQYVNAEEPKY